MGAMDRVFAVDATKPCAETGVTLAGGRSIVKVMGGGGACDGAPSLEKPRLQRRSDREVNA